jgi:hypothetical protein
MSDGSRAPDEERQPRSLEFEFKMRNCNKKSICNTTGIVAPLQRSGRCFNGQALALPSAIQLCGLSVSDPISRPNPKLQTPNPNRKPLSLACVILISAPLHSNVSDPPAVFAPGEVRSFQCVLRTHGAPYA